MPDILEGSHECKDDVIRRILQAACNYRRLRSVIIAIYLQILDPQEPGRRHSSLTPAGDSKCLPNLLGEGSAKVERLGNLIGIFENPALDFP